jgi:hypothetical protein
MVFLSGIRIMLGPRYVNRNRVAVEVTDADDYEHF